MPRIAFFALAFALAHATEPVTSCAQKCREHDKCAFWIEHGQECHLKDASMADLTGPCDLCSKLKGPCAQTETPCTYKCQAEGIEHRVGPQFCGGSVPDGMPESVIVIQRLSVHGLINPVIEEEDLILIPLPGDITADADQSFPPTQEDDLQRTFVAKQDDDDDEDDDDDDDDDKDIDKGASNVPVMGLAACETCGNGSAATEAETTATTDANSSVTAQPLAEEDNGLMIVAVKTDIVLATTEREEKRNKKAVAEDKKANENLVASS